jgi:hypothetical protein
MSDVMSLQFVHYLYINYYNNKYLPHLICIPDSPQVTVLAMQIAGQWQGLGPGTLFSS